MNATKWQWVALIWILAIFTGMLGLPYFYGRVVDEFWFILVGPFVSASLLGVWLTSGSGPVWLRLLGMLVGQCLLIWNMASMSHATPVSFTPGLAAATAFTAVAMLGLGCLGSVLPIQSTWKVRIALWEIVVSMGLIGVTLAIIRLLSEIYQWNWPNWAIEAGVHFLVFALYTGLLMTLVLLPVLVTGIGPRSFAAAMLLVAVVLIPLIEYGTFDLLNLRGNNLKLLYAAHIGQTVAALAITIPLVIAFPGWLVRQTPPAMKAVEPEVLEQTPPDAEQDFAQMQ